MAKKPMAKASGFTPPPAAPPPPPVKKTEIDITPAIEAREAVALRAQAAAIVVTDASTHSAALEFIHGAKQLKRKIETHWSAITRNVDDLKRNLLNLRRQDLEPVEVAIAVVSDVAIQYENAEKARAEAERERLRRQAEENAEALRAAELARLERQALKAEAESKELSDRERAFVAYVVANGEACAVQSAKSVGYADPQFGLTLLKRPKIVAAIKAKREALALREQQEATKAAPLDMQPIGKVAANLGHAAGVSSRTYYSAAVRDLEAFRRAVLDGTIPIAAVEPAQTFLNSQATQLRESFEAAYPGCVLLKRQGLAG